MQKSNKLLMVSFYYPPSGGAGVQRTVKFAKYLSRMGWSIFAIAAREGSYTVLDKSLEKDVAQVKNVYRVGGGNPLGFLRKISFRLYAKATEALYVPDVQIFWAVRAYFKAKRLVKAEKIETVYTTSGPYSTHLVGLWLSRRENIKWVADFRDEWTLNKKYLTPLHKFANKGLEKKVLEQANKVIFAHEGVEKAYKRMFKEVGSVAITNGFDKEDFEGAAKKNSVYTIAYMGNVYAESKNAFRAFCEAYKEFAEKNDVTLKIATFSAGAFSKVLEEKGVSPESYEILGHLDHSSAVNFIRSADLLLLLMSKERVPGLVHGKFYEYLAAGRIFNVTNSKSTTEKWIEKYEAGVSVPEEKDTILKALEEEYASKHKAKIDYNSINRFERKELTKKLDEVLRSL